MQALLEEHATATKLLFLTPVGFGVCWAFHVVPFQRSANANVPALLKEYPTAVQALLETHETPDRVPSKAPVGIGVCSTVQVVPFQRSAKVAEVALGPVPVKEPPTALQALAEVQETPSKPSPLRGLGVGWIDHLVPFQCSANVPDLVVVAVPTAEHALADAQDTALSSASAPLGFGVG